MFALAAFLFLGSLAFFIAGMIAPKRVIPGPYKTRRHALAYGAVGVLAAALVVIVAVPNRDAAARAALCTHDARHTAIIKEADNFLGRLPSEALRAGNTVVVKGKAIIGPHLGTDGTVDGTLAAITSLVQVSDGDTVEILERVKDRKGKLYYKARWWEKDLTGYINPHSMAWLNDGDRLAAFYEIRDAWMKPRLAALRKELFEDKGMNYLSVIEQAARDKWKCDQ